MTMKFSEGSIGTIHYFANGNKRLPKERLEVYTSGKVFLLDDFKRLKAWGVPGFQNRFLRHRDKGNEACIKKFVDTINKGGKPPIPINEILEIHQWLIGVS